MAIYICTDRTEHIVAAQLGKIEHELDANAKHINKLESELLSDKKGRKFHMIRRVDAFICACGIISLSYWGSIPNMSTKFYDDQC